MPFSDPAVEAAYRLRRYYERIAEGKCPRCNRERDRVDRKLCHRCRAYFQMKTKERYTRLYKEGRCYDCGELKELQAEGVYCIDCQDKNYYRTFINR